ncbi:hypothetical protein FRC03_003987, partial [Tulasnella sp. 419]
VPSTSRGVHSTAHVELDFEHVSPPPEAKPPPHSDATGPLIICHGLFGSKQNWRSLCKAFSRSLDRPVYALDLRNHGSSPHSESMSYKIMSDDIMEFCRRKSLSNVSLLGHSMGGKVAMTFALDPDRPSDMLSRLIVADISPAKGPISAEFRSYVKGMKEVEAKATRTRKEADEILQAYEPDFGTRQFLLTNLIAASSTTPQRFRIPLDTLDKAIEAIGDFPYEPEERKWEGKTLFIKGAKSKYLNRKNIPIAEQYFPNMRLETLDAGHWGTFDYDYCITCYSARSFCCCPTSVVQAEKPAEFLQLVTDFINS